MIAGEPHELQPPAAFAAPWQLRLYAVAAAAAEAGRLDRDVFLERFTAALQRARSSAGDAGPEDAYRCWLTALEQTLEEAGALSAPELAAARERAAAAAQERDHH